MRFLDNWSACALFVLVLITALLGWSMGWLGGASGLGGLGGLGGLWGGAKAAKAGGAEPCGPCDGGAGGGGGSYDGGEGQEYAGGRGVFRIIVGEPEFSALRDGQKTVEVRQDLRPFDKLVADQTVLIVRSIPKGEPRPDDGKPYKVSATVAEVIRYATFADLIKHEKLGNTFAGQKTAKGAEEYLGRYNRAVDKALGGLVAIHLRVDPA
jgi:ASC-1-like (ASCH) protein